MRVVCKVINAQNGKDHNANNQKYINEKEQAKLVREPDELDVSNISILEHVGNM